MSFAENKNIIRHNRGMFVDIHCHCLPGIDDGPSSMEQSLRLCKALVRDRIKTVIATPHQLGMYNRNNTAEKIREKAELLRDELIKNEIPLEIKTGADVRIDERICRLIEKDEVLTLGDSGKYILLELAPNVLVDIEPLLLELSETGIKSIISHPERHLLLPGRMQMLNKWIEDGASIQITAGSIVGKFGAIAKKVSWQILQSRAAVTVATDAHNVSSRRPWMRAAYELIRTQLGEERARATCIDNPKRILEGTDVRDSGICTLSGGNNETLRDKIKNYIGVFR